MGSNTTEVYVFGSNHFGQLGLGPMKSEGAPETGSKSDCGSGDDGINCGGQVKYLLPQRLEVGAARIRLIHTKFFTNVSGNTG